MLARLRFEVLAAKKTKQNSPIPLRRTGHRLGRHQLLIGAMGGRCCLTPSIA
jgi:hypothetical protein